MLSRLRSERAAWQLVGIRTALWLATAFTLLWAPLRDPAKIPPFHAYGPLSDLVFGTFVQWDSVWFIHIAEHGYDSKQITAFFPLYPLLVRGLATVLGSTIVAGVVLSLAAAGVAGGVLVRIARSVLGERAANDAVLYVALYPLAYVFTALYSDGLFLALAASSFLAAQRRRSLLAGLLGAAAVATRVMGLALVPALIALLWPRRRALADWRQLAPVLLVPLPLVAYGLFLRHRFGDALSFVHAESDVSWNHHTHALGPLSGLWESTRAGWQGTLEIVRHLPRSQGSPTGYVNHDMWASWNVLQFALLVVAIWLTVEAWRHLGLAFGLYSTATLAMILTSPAAIVPLVSAPRYLLADFPLFIALARVTDERPALRQGVIVCFAVVSGFAAVAFARKVWIA